MQGPDESRGYQTEKNKRNAEKLRAERVIMRATGMTRGELRTKLDDFQKTVQATQALIRAQAPPAPPAIDFKVDQAGFEPRDFSGQRTGVGQDAANVAGVRLTGFIATESEDGDEMGVARITFNVQEREDL